MNLLRPQKQRWFFASVSLALFAAGPLSGCGNFSLDADTLDALQGVLSGLSDNMGGAADDRGGTRATGVSDDPPGDDKGTGNNDPPGDDHGGLSADNAADDDSGMSSNGGLSTDDGGNAGELRLETRLAGDTAAKGNADYRVVDGDRRKFKVEVENFPPGEYEVRINGVAVAKIAVGATGFAEIEFDSKVEPGHQPLPENFPAEIKAGDTINVGGLAEGRF